MEITNDPVIGHIKYERPGILVDRDDTLGVSHADNVLNGARNAAVDIQRRSDRASALPDEMCVRDPAFVHCDRVGAFPDELLIEDVEHLEEGCIFLYAFDFVGFEMSLFLGVTLTPYLEFEIHKS